MPYWWLGSFGVSGATALSFGKQGNITVQVVCDGISDHPRSGNPLRFGDPANLLIVSLRKSDRDACRVTSTRISLFG